MSNIIPGIRSNSRQLVLDALNFNDPERIPVIYHPSPAGLFVHGQKLLDLFNEYPPDNPIVFNEIPSPNPNCIDAEGRYHEYKYDEWGTCWEYLIYGIQGHPKKYPLKNWKEANHYILPKTQFSSQKYIANVKKQKKDYLVFDGGISIYDKLHALRPMDEFLMDLYTGEKNLMNFINRLTNYWLDKIDKLIAADVDGIFFADDWGSQYSSIVSPALYREIFKPLYEKLFDPIKKADKKIFLHACGFLGEILDDFFELGIDCLWPQLPLYENDPKFITKCIEHKVAIYIHPDRQNLIPLGTPKQIESKIKNYAEKYHKIGGGAIFYVEIENDSPFENVEALIKSIHKYR